MASTNEPKFNLYRRIRTSSKQIMPIVGKKNGADMEDIKGIKEDSVEMSVTEEIDEDHTRSSQDDSYEFRADVMHEGRGGDEPYPVARNTIELLKIIWADYKFTWVGFFDNHKNKDEAEDDDVEPLVDVEKIKEKQKELQKNVHRNVETLKEGGTDIADEMKEITGIRNKRDLKKWSMEQLQLANECVAEFMRGYRIGRDEEIDKMMNEYFNDIDFDDEGDDDKIDDVDDQNNQNEKNETTSENKAGRKRRRRKS